MYILCFLRQEIPADGSKEYRKRESLGISYQARCVCRVLCFISHREASTYFEIIYHKKNIACEEQSILYIARALFCNIYISYEYFPRFCYLQFVFTHRQVHQTSLRQEVPPHRGEDGPLPPGEVPPRHRRLRGAGVPRVLPGMYIQYVSHLGKIIYR